MSDQSVEPSRYRIYNSLMPRTLDLLMPVQELGLNS